MKNRVIKFRAWDGFKMYEPCVWMGKEYIPGRDTFIENDWIMQFTGLKVKGVDLYESDVIEATIPDGVPVRHIISFEDGSFIHQNVKYESLTGRIKQSWLDEIGFEIIGNIHQHEHLLK